MSNLSRRIERLESAAGAGNPRVCCYKIVDTPEKAHTPGPDDSNSNTLWGCGPDTWRIYIKPGQSEDDALRQAGIDPDKDTALCWGMA